MRAKAMLWIVGLGLLASGCSVVSTATCVVTSRMKEVIDDCVERRRNGAWAEAAWADVCLAHGGLAFSDDHAEGFKAGFAEHLYRGAVQPPPLPPASYRSVHYQSPEGYRAIEDWFAGFRHGVSVAQSGGYRDLVTGPSSLRAPPPLSPLPMRLAPGKASSAPAVPLLPELPEAPPALAAPLLPLEASEKKEKKEEKPQGKKLLIQIGDMRSMWEVPWPW